jgi:hypothetical protein
MPCAHPTVVYNDKTQHKTSGRLANARLPGNKCRCAIRQLADGTSVYHVTVQTHLTFHRPHLYLINLYKRFRQFLIGNKTSMHVMEPGFLTSIYNNKNEFLYP